MATDNIFRRFNRSTRRFLRLIIVVVICLGTFKWILPMKQGSGYFDALSVPEVRRSSPRPTIEKLWDVRKDGKLVVPVVNGSQIGSRQTNYPSLRHPILDLVEDAERQWDAKLRRQSQRLEEAVIEYQRRYRRLPPKGFDRWFEFAVSRGVVLLDEFDQIYRDISPFLAIPPEAVQVRMQKAANHFDTYHISVKDGKVFPGNEQEELSYLMEDFARWLPDMTLHVSIHDMGPHLYGDDFRAEVDRVLAAGEYMSAANITHFESKQRNKRKTVTKSCLPAAPAVLWEDAGQPDTSLNDSFSFIRDLRATQNFCDNPSILQNQGTFLHPGAPDSFIFPLFVQCKLAQGGCISYPSLFGFDDFINKPILPWSKRISDKLFWRGRMTGAHYRNDRPWRTTHRIRLHDMANNRTMADDVVQVLHEDADGNLDRRSYRRKELNAEYLDVGLIEPVFQCEAKDGTCDIVAKHIEFVQPVYGPIKTKYALDIDGNGWSGRFQTLLASGSLVLKATIFPEWNSDWLVPYYHFIPVQHDYSDLYDVMMFFRGAPGEEGTGHDDLAERIGLHGADHVRRFWRWDDLQAYMFRLLLEYARATSVDRDAMTYKPSH